MAPRGLQVARRTDDGTLQFLRLDVHPWQVGCLWIAYSPGAYRAADGCAIRDVRCVACKEPLGSREFTICTALLDDVCPSDKLHLASLAIAVHADCVIPDGKSITELVLSIAQMCED